MKDKARVQRYFPFNLDRGYHSWKPLVNFTKNKKCSMWTLFKSWQYSEWLRIHHYLLPQHAPNAILDRVALAWQTPRWELKSCLKRWGVGWVFWEDHHWNAWDRSWPACFSVATTWGKKWTDWSADVLCWLETEQSCSMSFLRTSEAERVTV